MDESTVTAVRKHFEEWSGGFPPESEMEIFVYVEYAREVDDAPLVQQILRDWLHRESE